MQQLSSALTTALINIDARIDPRTDIDLYEFYSADYVPGVNGFDPTDAIERFAAEEVTWNGNAYRREVISRGDIVRNMGEKTNSVSLTFSNVSRYLATLAQNQTIEGLLLCIRCVVPSVTDDSVVEFHGRCDKPGDIDKMTFSLSAREDFGNINVEIPPRLFTAEDPNGRTPSDPLYEGFRLTSQSGTFPFPVTTPSTSFIGRLLGKSKHSNETRQWSASENTFYGSVVPMIFGRCQMELIPILFVDAGYNDFGVWVVGEGRVDNFFNVTIRDDRMLLQTQDDHFGDLGGTGTNSTNMSSPTGPINQGYLSRTAYTILSMYGSAGDTVDEAVLVTALVRGIRVAVPNASGVYDSEAWSDNPVNIARFILTDPRLVGIDPGFMEDAVNYLTAQHCDEALIDDSNGEVSMISTVEQAQAGVTIHRFASTGILNTRSILYNRFGDTSIVPEEVENTYTTFSPDNISTTFPIVRLLRKRYTINVPLTDRQRAVDCLYKLIFIAAKLYLKVNKRGKYEILSEKPADATHLRIATSVGATAIQIQDVMPWKTGPDLLTGRLLLGAHLITSEVRNVSSANYSTAGNSVTLAASDTGGVTATASGANLSGGSTTVQASGTVTIGGTPAAGDTATVTIDGVDSVYTLNADDTTGTVAVMLSNLINANLRLNKYIKATWASGSPNVVTIKSKQGALNLDAALLLAHTGPVADPATSPSLSSSAGALGAGTYKVAYSNVTALGKTALSPTVSIVLTASQQIDVGAIALPAGVVSRNWYVSDAANSEYLKYAANQNGSAFSINALPLDGAALPPSFNTTGEELLRVAMSFATNSQDVFPAWSASTVVLLTDIYLPTVLNGHKYQVTTGGTTDTTEPVWPTTAGGTVASGTAVFTEIGSTVLQQAGLTRANIVKDSFKWPLNRQSSVNQIKISYRDANNDFALTPIRVNDPVRQAAVHKIYPMEVDGSAIDNFHQTFRIANWQLAKNCEGDWFDALTTGPQGLVLEEGDVICSSDDSGGLVNVVTRIEELRIKPDHTVEINQARKYSTNMFSDDVGADTIPIPTTLRFTQTVDSIIEFLDTPPIHDSDALIPGFFVNVSRDLAVLGDWRGWVLYADYGDGYIEVARGDIPAIMGTADSVLDTVTDATVFDTVSSLDFTLKFGPPPPFPAPFSTVTQADLDANPYRNLFLVGNEYVQAATIVSTGDQTYTISDFYRGRFETDGAELTHGADERVVFINGSEVFVPTDESRIGIEYSYKAVTTNQDVSEATPVLFTWLGNLIKSRKVTELNAARDPSGNWHVSAIGHPRELPAYYNLRVRRPVDDVIMRDIPIATGLTQAAVFGDTFGDILVTNNNLSPDTVVPFQVMGARTTQEITEAGSFIEFVLPSLDQFPGGSLNLGLFESSDATWTDTSAWTHGVYTLQMVVTDVTTGEWALYLWDVGGEDAGEVLLADYSVGLGKIKIRLTFSGTEMRVYKNWANSSSAPIVISKVPPADHFPMKAAFYLVTGAVNSDAARIEQVVIGGMTEPSTIYSKAQQDHDDPVTDMASIDAEMWEVTTVEGRKVRKEFP